MRLRKAAPYIAIYLLAALAIPLSFSGGWFRPFPEVNLYSGQLAFSGERAFKDLQTLVEGYPNRFAGTRAARTSALWVQKQMTDLGLDANIEEFVCLVKETSVKPDEVSTMPVGDLTYKVTGYNVVTVSPGKSTEAVVIGAHRDMSGGTQGAEDNGSGTVSVIELARVLTQGEHYYTYVFVSYDGEEAGLRGSEAFLQVHKDIPVKLAVTLDMTGYAKANTVGFYPFVSSKSASPFWTVALATDLAVAKELPLYIYGAKDGDTRSAVVNFWRARTERQSNVVPTDSGPYVDRGIPALGLIATQLSANGQWRIASIHNPEDTVAQVSPETLGMTGRFAEHYVRSLMLNRFTGFMNSRLYSISEDRVLPPQVLVGFSLYACALVLAMVVLSWRDSGVGLTSLGVFMRTEWTWFASALAAALASAGFPVLLRTSLSRHLSLTAFNVLWVAVTLLSIGAVAFLRARSLERRGISYYDATARQKVVLNLVYLLGFLALLALANPFAAVGAVIFPILFLGRVSFKSEDSRVLWSVATVGWVIISMFIMMGRLKAAVFRPAGCTATMVDFIRIGLWMLTAVYMLTVPRRGLGSPSLLMPRNGMVNRSEHYSDECWFLAKLPDSQTGKSTSSQSPP